MIIVVLNNCHRHMRLYYAHPIMYQNQQPIGLCGHRVLTRFLPDAAAPAGRIRVGEAFSQADSQSIKKPIDVFLIRSSPVFNEFSVAESITRWSRPFHLLTTRSEKKWRLRSKRHRFFINFAECRLVETVVFNVNKVSNGVVDHPLYILNALRRSARFLRSSRSYTMRWVQPLQYTH